MAQGVQSCIQEPFFLSSRGAEDVYALWIYPGVVDLSILRAFGPRGDSYFFPTATFFNVSGGIFGESYPPTSRYNFPSSSSVSSIM